MEKLPHRVTAGLLAPMAAESLLKPLVLFAARRQRPAEAAFVVCKKQEGEKACSVQREKLIKKPTTLRAIGFGNKLLILFEHF
jgi:invasion protein IalB